MKNFKHIKRIASVTGLLLGAFVLSAAAAGVWTPPTNTPPNGNVDAPVNVGDTGQAKTGLLGLKSFLFNPTGVANIPVGSVLTATNADGTVGWTNPETSDSSAGAKVTFGPYNTISLPVSTAGATTTVTGISSSAVGIVGFINSAAGCTDDPVAWRIWSGTGKQIAEAGARTGGGETVTAQSPQITIPLTNGQFRYATSAGCSGTLTVVAQYIP
jgi:hypothetical protein